MRKQRIAILGSTGSIGTQTLDVILQHSDKFEASVLTAGENVELLIKQAREFEPDTVIIANESKYNTLQEALADLPIKVFAGADAIAQIVSSNEVDTVVTAMVGFAGLQATVNAVKAKKRIALANKETLVVAGDLITRLAMENQAEIIPVDSEHSAIFQCLVGEGQNTIEKLILTASGGAFRDKTASELENITRNEALKHPTWEMGAKITIDSATLMNKGLEVIEAKWLFDVKPERIEVMVHPQSIVHSMVQFSDGSVKAQMGLPDMKLPIQYALSFPQRINSDFERMSLAAMSNLTFKAPNFDLFPCLNIAYEAINKGGSTACVMNAANEIAVDAFLNDKIKFTAIPSLIEQTIQKVSWQANPSLDDYFAIDAESRIIARELL
jgi:1-deoxy-D-xylulose-5-phosphate reductoisomerase